MGAPAVKVFPARAMGPGYIRDLRGPYPDARLVPTGGVDSANAREFLAAGAIAVGAGGGLFRSMGASPERDIQANAEALLGALSEYRKA
jgi:2-dehydro-3-deoxyphosphogluconate aldolase/(4S)-4-hydroxy-2-oxoglutarate aldolase